MFMYLCGLFNDTGNSWAVCRPMLGVIDERWIGKDLEGKACDVVIVLFCHLSGGTEEHHEAPEWE
jgi:hypothetical protein